ncbi:hypothetical protein HanRHA438_Chr14g0649221 [Helianthus annuus]|uniref:Uncharacterized protein n=1 Tax=Helianthus annuus TaxID=4232 RepID=A0A9K3E7Z8_HELAN|nr:uncharacterized protein LOC110887590 [Helianthus annuus]KAF5768646.1 hypothetical protein HanXRQr2_Chr14g0638791 [Helianthus annuus]KAJ0468143.1 hypothetical protein HanIR_Chr14g0693151 [Helianthus annuus]KAJ0655898.1 hypothetical protein HanLR1_Chr14g0529521 [Helianthus annuus]KAJ0659575.1 hypothetical protein HanOQP8_Chr14g0527631 [Helianthus annuus]KAJ0703243.1 hypothetical protein HanPI659440_Chr14g0548771 [Helianthus annuus]
MATTAATGAADATRTTTLRRRNSIEIPPSLTLHNKHRHPSSTPSSYTTLTSSSTLSSSSADYELVSMKPASYTSLRDILPNTVVQSPKLPSFAVNSGYEISIRNRLVKQAAWAYLQPMSSSPGGGGSTVFHRVWNQFSDVFIRIMTRMFDCFLRL